MAGRLEGDVYVSAAATPCGQPLSPQLPLRQLAAANTPTIFSNIKTNTLLVPSCINICFQPLNNHCTVTSMQHYAANINKINRQLPSYLSSYSSDCQTCYPSIVYWSNDHKSWFPTPLSRVLPVALVEKKEKYFLCKESTFLINKSACRALPVELPPMAAERCWPID